MRLRVRQSNVPNFGKVFSHLEAARTGIGSSRTTSLTSGLYRANPYSTKRSRSGQVKASKEETPYIIWWLTMGLRVSFWEESIGVERLRCIGVGKARSTYAACQISMKVPFVLCQSRVEAGALC